MEFTTQRELLEHLGKNPDDRNLVQRLIIKGEVVREWGVYVLVDKDARIAELEKEVSELRNEIVTMKESNWDLEELKVNCKYWEKQAKEYSQYCADIVDICYSKIKSAMWSKFMEDKETFKEWIQRMVKGESND